MNTKTYYQYRSDKYIFISALSPDTMKFIFNGGALVMVRILGVRAMDLRKLHNLYASFPVCVAVFKITLREPQRTEAKDVPSFHCSIVPVSISKPSII